MKDLTGSVLGQYHITQYLGGGGFAVVYKAWHHQSQKYVALKVLAERPDLVDAQTVQRFKQEARITARLTHPNIVPVYEADYVDDYYYIAMECLGKSLGGLLKEGLDTPKALSVLIQVATALDFAHCNGVVAHRDIKPANILMTSDLQTAKLSDFGIAVLNRGAIVHSSGSSVIGTRAYMAPEQLRPYQHVDARSDIYTLIASRDLSRPAQTWKRSLLA